MGPTTPLRSRLASTDAVVTARLTIPENLRAPRLIALAVAHSGDSLVLAALLLAAWLLGGEAWKIPILLAVAGLILAQLATVGIKVAVRRSRPVGKDGGIYRKYDPYSFPSGHAARASMLAVLAAMFAPLPLLVVVLAWSPVMLLSRVAIGIHYILDVLAGAALGALLTYVVVYAGVLLKVL